MDGTEEHARREEGLAGECKSGAKRGGHGNEDWGVEIEVAVAVEADVRVGKWRGLLWIGGGGWRVDGDGGDDVGGGVDGSWIWGWGVDR